MKVLKFGGTSVGTVESLSKVQEIVEAIPGAAIIVVSALGGFTDKLISMAKLAQTQDPEWKTEFEAAKKRHQDIINQVVPDKLKTIVSSKISSLFHELKQILENLTTSVNLPQKILDEVVSFGERMSSEIVAVMIENGKRHDSLKFIKTEKWYSKNVADSKLTENLIRLEFANLGENEKAIVPGFISTDTQSGEITNLGRGGSDYTGALIAAALDTELLEIWTDVDGFMTADPRIVKDAKVIDHLTFTESMELCSFGAKVIYPPTIFPVFHKKIPIKILNTFNPDTPGTLITDTVLPDDIEIKGVTALKGLTLKEVGRQATLVTDSGSKINISENLTELHKKPCVFAAIAIVGKEMEENYRLPSRIIHSLRRQSIEVKAISNESETTLILIVPENDLPVAIPHIHALLYQ